MEPLQYDRELELEAEVSRLRDQVRLLEVENANWRNGGYTNLWHLRTTDRDRTIETQRKLLSELRYEVSNLKKQLVTPADGVKELRLKSEIAELKRQLEAAQNSDTHNFERWQKAQQTLDTIIRSSDEVSAAPHLEQPEPMGYQVWFGLFTKQAIWPPYQTFKEATLRAKEVKSDTEVRPLFAGEPITNQPELQNES